MQLRSLGGTGIDVSPITIGAWQLGGPLFFGGEPDGHPDPGRENVIRMIRQLGDLGINAVDTAEQYGAGESERRVGEAIRGRRDHWVVSTKFGYRVGPGNVREDDSSPATILPSLEGSLRRLGTDRIDLFLYHCAPDADALDAGRDVLEAAKAQGKIRAYGISTNDTALLAKMVERRAVEVVQFASSLLDESPGVWKLCRENRLGTQVRGTMAQGRLSGKYFDRQPVFRPDDNRFRRCKEDGFRQYAVLADCLPPGMAMAQAAIRWILDHPGCHTVCMGAKNLADYRAAIAATAMPPLDPACRARLESAAARMGVAFKV